MYMRVVRRAILLVLVVLVGCTAVMAQGKEGFDPKRFQADMEAFIIKNARLSPKQAEKFFPLFREMQGKQRALFGEMRQNQNVDLNDADACARAIQRMDNIDVQIRKIQQEYHLKFMNVLPANVVMRILRAEDHFHRQAFRRAAKRGHGSHR